MKILIISNLYPNSLEKNRATFNKNQFLELSHYCSMKIIAPVAWTNKLFLKQKTGHFVSNRETIDGIEIFHPTYLFTPKILGPLYGFFYFFSIFFTSDRLIRSMKPDCILATWAYPDGFAAVMLGLLYKIPIYIKIHGSDIHGIRGHLRAKLTAWTLQKAQKVFSVSNNLKERAIELGGVPSKIVTIYNGLDHTNFFPQNKIEARKRFNIPLDLTVLLFVGNLESVKGPDILIEALSLIDCGPNKLKLYLTGKGSLQKKLQQQCKSCNLDNSVVFTGPVAHDDIAQWMNVADLLVVPSRNEGVPNVILEAMACKIPVVATRVGGIPEVVIENKTGFLVEPENPNKLAQAIKKAVNNSWNYDAILRESKKYSWTDNACQIIKYMKISV